MIAVNGGRDEIFRNFFYLLDRAYTSQFDPATCAAVFDSKSYYSGIEREAELIRRVDSRLAGYLSIYGHDFSRSQPLARLLDY